MARKKGNARQRRARQAAAREPEHGEGPPPNKWGANYYPTHVDESTTSDSYEDDYEWSEDDRLAFKAQRRRDRARKEAEAKAQSSTSVASPPVSAAAPGTRDTTASTASSSAPSKVSAAASGKRDIQASDASSSHDDDDASTIKEDTPTGKPLSSTSAKGDDESTEVSSKGKEVVYNPPDDLPGLAALDTAPSSARPNSPPVPSATTEKSPPVHSHSRSSSPDSKRSRHRSPSTDDDQRRSRQKPPYDSTRSMPQRVPSPLCDPATRGSDSDRKSAPRDRLSGQSYSKHDRDRSVSPPYYFDRYSDDARRSPHYRYSSAGVAASFKRINFTPAPFSGMYSHLRSPVSSPIKQRRLDSSDYYRRDDTDRHHVRFDATPSSASSRPPAKDSVLKDLKLHEALRKTHASKLSWTIDLSDILTASCEARTTLLLRLLDSLRESTRVQCAWSDILWVHDDSHKEEFNILDYPYRCTLSLARSIAITRLRGDNATFDQSAYDYALQDFRTPIFNTQLLAWKLTESLDDISKARMIKASTQPFSREPILQDGFWCLSWILHEICTDGTSFDELVRRYIDELKPASQDLSDYRTFVDRVDRIATVAGHEFTATLESKMLLTFCNSPNDRTKNAFQSLRARIRTEGVSSVRLSDMVTTAYRYLREESDNAAYASSTGLPSTSVTSGDTVLAMLLKQNEALLSRLDNKGSSSSDARSKPSFNRFRRGKAPSDYKHHPDWMKVPPDSSKLLEPRQWRDPDGKEFTFRWCQGCHLWTTNIRGHQFRHFTGHPNDRYPESSQPSKSTSQSAPRLERRDRRRNSTRDARRDSSSRTESCPPERSGSQPRHPSANVASAPATAPGPLPMFPSFDPMLMAAMVQSYHAFHAQQSQQNKK